MQERPPLSAIAEGDHVHVFRPVRDAILADEEFAPARTMNLDGRVVGVLRRGGLVAKDQCPAARIQDGCGTIMIRRIKSEGFGRHSGGNERLDQPVGRPRFLTPRLDDHRGLQGDCGQPERIHGGRIAGHDQAQGLAGGEKLSLVPNCSPYPRSRMVKSRPRDNPFRTSPRWVSA